MASPRLRKKLPFFTKFRNEIAALGFLGPNIIGGVSGNYIGANYNVIRYGDGTATLNDITSDHPISVVYDSASGTGMNPEATTAFGTGRVIADRLDVLGKVQCSSCHDVHNKFATGTTGEPLLRVTMAGSTLCLTCHNK